MGVTKMSDETVQEVYIVIEKSADKQLLKANYKTRSAILIGIIHIICGFLALSGNVSLFSTSTRFNWGILIPGIWSSIFFFISGGLSICSGKNPNSCLVISTMVMSNFSAISAGILIIFSSFGIAFNVDVRYHSTLLPPHFAAIGWSNGTLHVNNHIHTGMQSLLLQKGSRWIQPFHC